MCEGSVIEPEAILHDLFQLDSGLTPESYYGERSIFYNPGGRAPLGVIFASIKEHDGANDRSANLSRPGVYRFAFQVSREEFVHRFGAIPARPPKGGVVALPGYDPSRLDELMSHPVYGWMCWVQILAPTAGRFDSLRPLLTESLELVRAKWRKRRVG